VVAHYAPAAFSGGFAKRAAATAAKLIEKF
jgi:hypothetical protein